MSLEDTKDMLGVPLPKMAYADVEALYSALGPILQEHDVRIVLLTLMVIFRKYALANAHDKRMNILGVLQASLRQIKADMQAAEPDDAIRNEPSDEDVFQLCDEITESFAGHNKGVIVMALHHIWFRFLDQAESKEERHLLFRAIDVAHKRMKEEFADDVNLH